jgi:hypothetical protein
MIKIAKQRIHNDSARYIDHLYGEKELGGTGWMYLSSVPFEQVGFDVAVQNEPILNNVKDFLSTVPMVLAIWPALFTGFHLLATNKGKHGHDDHDAAAHGEEDDKS